MCIRDRKNVNHQPNLLSPSQLAEADSLKLVLEKYNQRNILPGFSVAIFNQDTIFFQESFGYADLESKKTYTSETVQNIASITKTFVGISLMKIVEEGKVNLEDPTSWRHLCRKRNKKLHG